MYRAHDPRLRRDVAIKVISRALASDGVTVDRFIREALSASALNHPNVGHDLRDRRNAERTLYRHGARAGRDAPRGAA